MKSLNFPKIFNSSTTNVIVDKEATASNLKALLMSETGELLGDPYYGVALKAHLFEQNNYVLVNILIDEIYTKIVTFMPQLTITRDDIVITSDERGQISIQIRALNKLDYTTDLYNIVIFQGEGE